MQRRRKDRAEGEEVPGTEGGREIWDDVSRKGGKSRPKAMNRRWGGGSTKEGER